MMLTLSVMAVAFQRGVWWVFNASVSFQKREAGLEHQIEMPRDIPQPETLSSYGEYLEQLEKDYPENGPIFRLPTDVVDIRFPHQPDLLNPEKTDPIGGFWFKFNADIGDDPLLHRSALAFISDKVLMSTSLLPHGIRLFYTQGGLLMASTIQEGLMRLIDEPRNT